MSTPRFTEHDTTMSLWLKDPENPEIKDTRDKLIAHLRGRGFSIENDLEVDECIREGYHCGSKGALEVRVEARGRCLQVEFFQNVVYENRNGGRYDFDRRKKMPFLIGKQYELERTKIAALVARLGFPLLAPAKLHGMAEITHRRSQLSQSHSGIYDRSPEAYNQATAAGDLVADGDTVHFRHWDQRWHTGTAYRNINNMWWVLLPCGTITNLSRSEIHRTAPEGGLKGRTFSDGARKKKQMEALQKASRRNDLKRITILRALLTPALSYYVLSLKHSRRDDAHVTLWGQSASGYQYDIGAAGKYSHEEIAGHLGYYNSGSDIAVEAETVERLIRMCDKTDRDLGGPVPTLANTMQNWRQLLSHCIAPPKYTELPAICATKSGKAKKAFLRVADVA